MPDCKSCRDANHKEYWAGLGREYKWSILTINNHRMRGFEVNISIKELEALAIATKCCPICGRELIWDTGKGRTPAAPSLDRKFNGKRLTLKNTWIICRQCNMVKQDLPMPEFVEYCQMVVEKFSSEAI